METILIISGVVIVLYLLVTKIIAFRKKDYKFCKCSCESNQFGGVDQEPVITDEEIVELFGNPEEKHTPMGFTGTVGTIGNIDLGKTGTVEKIIPIGSIHSAPISQKKKRGRRKRTVKNA